MKIMVEKWSAKVRHLQKLKQNRNLKFWNAECWIHEAFRENKLKWQILNNASMPKYWTELIRHFRTNQNIACLDTKIALDCIFVSLWFIWGLVSSLIFFSSHLSFWSYFYTLVNLVGNENRKHITAIFVNLFPPQSRIYCHMKVIKCLRDWNKHCVSVPIENTLSVSLRARNPFQIGSFYFKFSIV